MGTLKCGISKDVERFLRKKPTSTETGVTVSFVCCGIKYSKNDIETYWCIDTDINKPVQKKFVGNNRVVREVVDSLTCKKNGCLKVKIFRYGIFRGKRKLLETECLSGLKASEYLQATEKVRIRQPLACPIQSVPYSKYIDYAYGKVLDSTTQRARYLNEQDWASKDKIKSECRRVIE